MASRGLTPPPAAAAVLMRINSVGLVLGPYKKGVPTTVVVKGVTLGAAIKSPKINGSLGH